MLNDAEFPPHSGISVLADQGVPVSLQFASGISDFGGYFTYIEPFTVIAYDALNNDIGEAHSAFSSNYTSSGNPTNEFMGLSGIGLIDHVKLVGNPHGGSFTADDIGFSAPSSVTPEAPAVGYLALGLVLLAAARARKES